MQWLTEATKEDFWNLAWEQRDAPEQAMLKVQRAMEGGVLNPMVEDVGDLIHRMTERPTFDSAGYEYVKKKVDNCIRRLTNEYGFRREMEENIVNNAKYLKIPVEVFRKRVYDALNIYAIEHSKLPTYNRAQKLAQIAAISIGKREFHRTLMALRMLQTHLVLMPEWINFAHQGLTDR